MTKNEIYDSYCWVQHDKNSDYVLTTMHNRKKSKVKEKSVLDDWHCSIHEDQGLNYEAHNSEEGKEIESKPSNIRPWLTTRQTTKKNSTLLHPVRPQGLNHEAKFRGKHRDRIKACNNSVLDDSSDDEEEFDVAPSNKTKDTTTTSQVLRIGRPVEPLIWILWFPFPV